MSGRAGQHRFSDVGFACARTMRPAKAPNASMRGWPCPRTPPPERDPRSNPNSSTAPTSTSRATGTSGRNWVPAGGQRCNAAGTAPRPSRSPPPSTAPWNESAKPTSASPQASPTAAATPCPSSSRQADAANHAESARPHRPRPTGALSPSTTAGSYPELLNPKPLAPAGHSTSEPSTTLLSGGARCALICPLLSRFM